MIEQNFSPAHRIETFGTYYFSTLGETIKKLTEKNMDIIRLDIGSPDLPPTPEIIEALYQSAKEANHHGYTLHTGTAAFRKMDSRVETLKYSAI